MKPPHPVTTARTAPWYVWLLLALTAGCGGGDDAAEPAVTTVATVATTAAPASTTTSTTTPPTTAPPPLPRPTAREAVDALLGAWRAGDRAGALTAAEVAAVDAIFTVAPERGEDRGCNEPPPGLGAPTYCVFRLDAGELQVRAVERPGGFVVDQVILGPP
jgi:hypothetical protein